MPALSAGIWMAAAASTQAQDAPPEESASEQELAEGVYARVIVDRTELRSGPGVSFQRVRVAQRGDVFRVVERAPTGFWFRVELADGTHAYIHGDTVYNHQISQQEASGGRFLPELFAPPPLPNAAGELAVQFGILGFFNGFMAVRPTFFVQPEAGIEINLAGSVGDGGRILLAGAGGVINVFPDSPVVPFVVVGGGIAFSDPNADTFLIEQGSVGALYGGGGFRFGFRYRLTVRIEARGYAFFDEDRVTSLEEISLGMTVFF